MRVPVCRHIRTNGLQCQAPALKDNFACYFHHRLYQRHSGFRHSNQTSGSLIPGQHIELTALEDRASVQVALSVVINALATGQLEVKRAAVLLYGLQLAAGNAAKIDWDEMADESVLDAEPTDDGLDLAEPGAVIDL
jgi:hypothetical protein